MICTYRTALPPISGAQLCLSYQCISSPELVLLSCVNYLYCVVELIHVAEGMDTWGCLMEVHCFLFRDWSFMAMASHTRSQALTHLDVAGIGFVQH